MHLEYKTFPFLTETAESKPGSFSGKASPYGIVDLGNDKVMPGAFTVSLKENGGVVPVCNAHDQKDVIGLATVEDGPEGLMVKSGQLELELQSARDTHIRMKSGLVRGLSIGYRTMRSKKVGGVRELHEVKLFEVSPVAFPMAPPAQINSVKSGFGSVAEEIKAGALSQASVQFLTDIFGLDEAKRLSHRLETKDDTLDEQVQDIRNAVSAACIAKIPQYGYITALYADYAVICTFAPGDQCYYRVDFKIGADGTATVSDPVAVEQAWVPAAVDTPADDAAAIGKALASLDFKALASQL